MPELPARMVANDREADLDFDPTENLFRRFAAIEVQGEELHTDQLPFYPAMSVNREKYSQPHDVLFPDYFRECGVFKFFVQDIPPPFRTDGATYEWNPEHVPESDNYAHSEVRTLRNGSFESGLRIKSSLVKKWFREYLRDRAKIVIRPGTAIPDE